MYCACKEGSYSGSARNCTSIGSGTHAITTLGDARVMSMTNPPAQAAALTYDRVGVERGGAVCLGSVAKPVVSNSARLNTVAAAALLSQLGLAAEDPAAPLALTAGSYQGTWDFRQADSAVSTTNGTTVFIRSDGTSSCRDKSDSMSFACTVTITDPATGAFACTDETTQASGSFGFATGLGSGSFTDSSVSPPTGSFVAGRR